jgi:hypothetical protein
VNAHALSPEWGMIEAFCPNTFTKKRRHAMVEEKFSWVDIVLKEGIRAATWGIVLTIIMTAFLFFVKQNIKEAIDFSTKRAVLEAVRYGTDPFLIGKGKQLIKEGLEYSIDRAGNKYREVLVETLQSAQVISAEKKKKE